MGKIYIVAIDGLDGVGKSTFTAKLMKKMKLFFSPIAYIKYIHFPAYRTTTGEKIKKLLFETNIDENERKNQLISLNIDNRMEVYRQLTDSQSIITRRRCPTIIIADRFMCSNAIYNRLQETDWMISVSHDELKEIGFPTIQCFAFCDPKLQLQRLQQRASRDQYETDINMITLNKEYPNFIDWWSNNHSGIPTIKIATHVFDTNWVQDSGFLIDEYYNETEPDTISSYMLSIAHNMICDKLLSTVPELIKYRRYLIKDPENYAKRVEACESINNRLFHEYRKTVRRGGLIND
jgi:thymidylate kinase